MTNTDISTGGTGGAIDRAKAKIDATHQAVLTFVPGILDAHKKAEDAEKLGYQQSLAANIALGEILSKAKEATKGKFKWTDWRAENIPQITQTKASLCMRLYKGKDRLTKPDPTSEDGKRISDGVANLLADNRMTVRKAAALLVTRTRTNPTRSTARNNSDLDVVKRCIKDVLAADELIAIVVEVRDADYLKAMAAALHKALTPPATQASTEPSSSAGVPFQRRH
jgi:hypothetical protein